MSIQATLERVSAIRQAMADPAELMGGGGLAPSGGVEAPSEYASSAAGGTPAFATALAQANAAYGTSSAAMPAATGAQGLAATGEVGAAYPAAGVQGLAPVPAGNGAGARIVAIAESQLGQAEQPPGSNESPAIAEYRTATAGAEPGAPWCAYFASWVARQAGEPIGAGGQGLGAVSEIWSWAQSTGRAVPNGPGVVPRPGDLIVFGSEHVGIVRGVLPDGRIETIEGNYENKVAANTRTPGEATGYVSMG
jgi:hypothetical protein